MSYDPDELIDDPDELKKEETRPKPPLSPTAARIIEALQDKPEILLEVADHFYHGWPTENLVRGWAVETILNVPVLSRRLFDDEHAELLGGNPVAHILQLKDQGYDGTQWVAAVARLEPVVQAVRRVHNSVDEAAVWVAFTLKQHGLIADPGLPTDELLAEFQVLLFPPPLTPMVLRGFSPPAPTTEPDPSVIVPPAVDPADYDIPF